MPTSKLGQLQLPTPTRDNFAPQKGDQSLEGATTSQNRLTINNLNSAESQEYLRQANEVGGDRKYAAPPATKQQGYKPMGGEDAALVQGSTTFLRELPAAKRALTEQEHDIKTKALEHDRNMQLEALRQAQKNKEDAKSRNTG